MVHTTKTITVILLENKKRITINEDDFDPTKHQVTKGDTAIPTAIDTYLKSKSEGKASKPSAKKVAVVDTKKKDPDANAVSKTIPRKRIALK